MADQSKAALYRIRLADSLRRLAWLKLDAGDAAGADARRTVTLIDGRPTRSGSEWFGSAFARATLALAAAGRGSAATSTAGASELADQAMSDFRRAAAMGYRNPAAYRYEPPLAPLRRRGDFRLPLLDLHFPADPFARGGGPGPAPDPAPTQTAIVEPDRSVARFGVIDEWHLDFQNPVPHIAFGIPPGFSEKAVVFGSAFPQPRFKSVGPIGDSVFGDCIEQTMVEELAKGRVVFTSE